jgi:hypothetical protein
MQLPKIICFSILLLATTVWTAPTAHAQDSGNRTSTTGKSSRKSSRQSEAGEPWKSIPLLLDRPEKPFEVIGLVSAPQIFLWDDEESMKESLQKQAWKMKADAVVLDRVDTSFRFTGPAGGANGRAIRYK